MIKVFFYILFLFVSFLWSCGNNKTVNNKDPVVINLPEKTSTDSSVKKSISDFNYDLKKPSQLWRLPSALVEVSGNTWVDEERLILIEDIHPNLYLIKLDGKKASLEKEIPFQKDEKDKFDIEDVTIVDDVAYALWSHGVLLKINNWRSAPDVQKISTFLSKKNNAEGLCYDPVTKKLLIANKDDSGLKDEKKSTKAVYSFDMASQKLDADPFLVIREKDFETVAADKIKFNPSAIAVHPETNDIYILSTHDTKCMAVFSRNGKLKSFQFIDEDLMPQPEGICFSPEGVLYISSEGKKKEPGNLFQFDKK
ncbi:MAG TPA: SdiA-regulated domain-containing protein [Hanamia sp.]|nr:SdiA-regulated domain-containing protein [Hanamia sp.]